MSSPPPEKARPWPRAGPLEWLAWAAVLVSTLAHGLMQIRCDDVGWHLATARLALESGSWPVVNSFSYTHPDFTLYCQYPVFQTLIYATQRLASWEGLSMLMAAGWLAVLLLLVRWSGRFRLAAALHLPWMLALLALQRRMMLRPEMVSMLFFGLTLLVIDGYLRGRRRLVLLLPLIHLLWVNAHQLFPVSLALQALLVIHLWLSRHPVLGIDLRHARLPILPAVGALAGSVLVTFLTPLGLDVVHVTAWTADTLVSHRSHVLEFAYLWDRPLELRLAILCAVPALLALWLGRRRWWPFEVGLLLLSLALVLSTMRGIVFFSVVSIAFFARTVARHPPPARWLAQVRPAVGRLVRVGLALMTLALAGNIVYHRWIAPPMQLGGTHPGIGRTLGDWPDAAIAALKAAPPPGRMMNLTWFAASPLIWEAPKLPPFVDPRFEAFPRPFLEKVIRSYDDDDLLGRLIRKHRPGWIYAEHCVPNVRARLAHLARQRAWVPTYVDAQILVLVRRSPETAAYRAAHALAAPEESPRNLVAHAGLRAQQLACYAGALEALGWTDRARRELRRARTGARGDTVAERRVEEIWRGIPAR
jgi:hypothetical protein